MTEDQARELLLTNYLYYGVMMVKMGDADGMVSGSNATPLQIHFVRAFRS